MTEGCGGDGVRIAKDNQGPKDRGLEVEISFRRQRFTLGCSQLSLSPQCLRVGLQPAPSPVGHLRGHTSISCHRQRRPAAGKAYALPDSLPPWGVSLVLGRQKGTISGNPVLSLTVNDWVMPCGHPTSPHPWDSPFLKVRGWDVFWETPVGPSVSYRSPPTRHQPTRRQATIFPTPLLRTFSIHITDREAKW